MSTTWLAVTPLDTIMVRDGRPFDARAASSATSVPPAPNTLGGVVQAAIGLDRVADHLVGPFVDTDMGLVFPTPLDVVRDEQTVRRLKVDKRDSTAESDLDEHDRLRHHLVGDGDPVSDWISEPGLSAWLSGVMTGGDVVEEPPLLTDPAWVPETRLGLARHWSGPLAGTADPGLLYSMTQLRPRDKTRFLVGCVDDQPIEIREILVPLGGRGRLAEVTIATAPALPTRLTGGYEPSRLASVRIPKEDGEQRILHIPPVVDRIVERAILAVLTPLIDPLLGPSSFAYRPGLGVVDAVQEVARLRDEGFSHVLRTDIADCFPHIQVDRLSRILGVLVPDPDLMAVIELLLTRPLRGPGKRWNRPGIGLPQGSPLSPIMANLTLEHLDERLRRAGYPVVRYSDDVAIFATSRDEALEAGRVASAAAEEIGMTLGDDKTDAMSFDTGFCFLGEDFGTRYPPVIENRIDVPEERTVFVAAAGSRIRIDEGRVVVERNDEELLDVPAGLVARIVWFGPVGVTAGLRNWALSSGVELVFCSQRGRYLGQIISGHTNRIDRLRH